VREADPVKGPSPWKRAVRGGAQVLVCPNCQSDPTWTDELDRCPHCGSWRLVRMIGQTSCRGCGQTLTRDAGPTTSAGVDRDRAGLAADVEAALSDLWGRNADDRDDAGSVG